MTITLNNKGVLQKKWVFFFFDSKDEVMCEVFKKSEILAVLNSKSKKEKMLLIVGLFFQQIFAHSRDFCHFVMYVHRLEIIVQNGKF